MNWFDNPWGWPTIFGLGDDCAKHPVDPDYPMMYSIPAGWLPIWDEESQLEYAVDLN